MVGRGSRLPASRFPLAQESRTQHLITPTASPNIRGKGLPMLSTPGAWAFLRAELMDALARGRRRRGRTGEGGRGDDNGQVGTPPPHDSRLRGNPWRNT